MTVEGGQAKRRPGRPVGSDGALSEKVTFQVTPDMLEKVEHLAELSGVDRSTWLRQVIESRIYEYEKGTP